MARPTKPSSIIELEKKSHRTKKELQQRKDAEASLLSGIVIKESKEVKDNQVAHKEFSRIKKLFKNIQKNDELYGAVLNRYCIIRAECKDLVVKREECYELIQKLKEEFDSIKDDLTGKERANYLIQFTREIASMENMMIDLDKSLQAKRKMLLDIEKECVMTIASSLRSIPKQTDSSKDDPLIKVLRGGA